MSDFPKKLKSLRTNLNMTQSEFAEKMGLSMSYISQLELGKRTPSDSVETLVRMLQMQFDSGLIEQRQKPHDKVSLRETPTAYDSQAKLRRVPIIGWAHAGEAEAYEEVPQAWQETIATDCPMEKAFGVRLEGDSMEPKFFDGDVLVVMAEEQAYSGCFAVVKFQDDGVVFRRIELLGSTIRLMPLNQRYAATDHSHDEFAWIYPVWGRFTQLWNR